MAEDTEMDDKIIFILLSEILVKLHYQQVSAFSYTKEALNLLSAIQAKISSIGLNESHNCCKVFVDTCQELRSKINDYFNLNDKDHKSEVRLLKKLVTVTGLFFSLLIT